MNERQNMAQHGSLTAKQERLILALAQGCSVADAAHECQVAERTAYRWVKDEAFAASYTSAQKRLFERGLTGLMTGLDKAIDGIKNIAKDEMIPAAVRLRAYQIWLEQAISVYKMSELEAQVAELRDILKARNI
jgi:hypothetical protein